MANLNTCLGECDTHSNEIELLINKLRKEVKSFYDDTTAKLLLHDGKIAELCNYIKINLSNELRTLIDTMESNGELEEILNQVFTDNLDTIQSDIATLKNDVIDLQKDKIVSVKDFGAKGDGLTDDSIPFKNALESGSKLFIPEGTYIINSKIDITIDKPLIIEGSGIEKTLIKFTDNSGYGLTIRYETGFWSGSRFQLSNLNIVGKYGIELNGGQQPIIKNVKFYDEDVSRTGTGLLLNNESHYAIIENCLIFGFNRGIDLNASNGCLIENNYISYCNNPVYLNSTSNKLLYNDFEGYNHAVIINGDNNTINSEFERNERTTDGWLLIMGNNNQFNVIARSVGGTLNCLPFVKLMGNYNTGIISGNGYTPVENYGHSNHISINHFKSLEDYPVLSNDQKNGEISFDSKFEYHYFDSEQSNLENIVVSNGYTLGTEQNQYIANSDSNSFGFNLSNIVPNGEDFFIIAKVTTVAGGQPYWVASGRNYVFDNDVIMYYKNKNIIQLSNNFVNTGSFIINRLIIAPTITNEMLKLISSN